MNRIIELTIHDGTRYSVGSDVIAIDEVMDNGEMAMVTNYVVSYRGGGPRVWINRRYVVSVVRQGDETT